MACHLNLRRVLTAFAAFVLFGYGVSARGAERDAGDPSVIHQLRIYEIFEGNKRQFHDRFRDHAMRIMARYDFNIVAMWEAKDEERTEFVYLLEWPDETTLKDRWTKFMEDEEWAEIKRATRAKYGQLVGAIEDRTLRLTSYSRRQVAAELQRTGDVVTVR